MNLVENFKDVVQNKYAQFTGRARRSEYWNFFLANIIISLGLSIVAGILGVVSESLALLPTALSSLVSLALLVPGIAIAIRRLHDTGRSGWWLLVAIVPLIGAIALIIFLCQDSQPGANEYGPNPKTGSTAMEGITRHLVD